MIQKTESIFKKEATPCSREDFYRILRDERNRQIIKAVRGLKFQGTKDHGLSTKDQADNAEASAASTARAEASAAEARRAYHDEKNRLKRQLRGVFRFCAKGSLGSRRQADVIPSGFGMIDLDGCAATPQWPANESFCKEQDILLVHITPSGHGLRFVYMLLEGETLAEGMERMQKVIDQLLGAHDGAWDKSVKNADRLSYPCLEEDVLYLDERLFEEEPVRNNTEKAVHRVISGQNSERRARREARAAAGTAEASNTAQDPLNNVEEQQYDGIAWADIIDQYVRQLAVPKEGNRNNSYYRAAVVLRHVVEDEDVLLAHLPDWGLAESERQAVIRSAMAAPKNATMRKELRIAIASLRERQAAAKKADNQQVSTTLPELPKGGPALIQMLKRHLPKGYYEAAVISCLPILGAYATGVRMTYLDGKEHSLSLHAGVCAPSASHKSFLATCWEVLLREMKRQDEVQREREREYRDACRRAKNSQEQPENPRAFIRVIPVTISNSQLLEYMDNARGKHLVSVSEELDTLYDLQKRGPGYKKSDIYRYGFDGGEWGQAFKPADSYSASLAVRYNFTCTGTPGAFGKFFPESEVENGLALRMAISYLPDSSFQPIRRIEPFSQAELAAVDSMMQALQAEHGTLRCAAIDKTIRKWLNDKLEASARADDRVLDTLRKRAAAIAFRAAYIIYLLNGKREDSQAISYVTSFARWCADYVLETQTRMFGHKLERALAQSDYQPYAGKTVDLLGALPEVFSLEDLVRVRLENGKSTKTGATSQCLTRWRQGGVICDLGDGRYRKRV